jgi:phosphoribosylaminoimidazole-succinocarboxamide synthase
VVRAGSVTETLGERYKKQLEIALQEGLISKEQFDEWIAKPPRSKDEAAHRKLVLKLCPLP